MNVNTPLRKKILARRDALAPSRRRDKSRRIGNSLLDLPLLDTCTTLLVYVAFRSEVQTLPIITALLKAGKTVAVPLTLVREKRLRGIIIEDPKKDLSPGYCGIPEPENSLINNKTIEPAALDLIIVPGSVFDRQGGRLGYGGGYYDRFLSMEAPQATRIALAYELQIVDKIHLEPHDQTMDMIITENNVYTCRRS
ncbi:MAG TPA: 5-formyltetrahydrofolate cyclo-ligase [Desulfobulbaceae bacterium]|nr:5-formyltetrahydrofolate cyclo-ligase [Desulfobulbaceae bacterium]